MVSYLNPDLSITGLGTDKIVGDISLVKLDRSPIDGNLVQRPKQVSTCRNWDPIMKWARLQAPSHDHGPILEHPTLGILESDAVNETQAVSR